MNPRPSQTRILTLCLALGAGLSLSACDDGAKKDGAADKVEKKEDAKVDVKADEKADPSPAEGGDEPAKPAEAEAGAAEAGAAEGGEEAGDEEAGDEEAGDEEAGDEEAGDEEAGDEEAGDEPEKVDAKTDPKKDPKKAATKKDPAPKKDPEPAASGADGKALYAAKCKNCHGASGAADTKLAEKHDIESWKEAGWKGKWPTSKIENIVTNGKAGTKMKPFKDKMTADEIKAVSKYAFSLGK